MKYLYSTATTFALAVSTAFTFYNLPAQAFNITHNNNGFSLQNILLGNTTGLSNIKVLPPTRYALAYGTFQNDPFGLGSGVVLSTGQVEDLAGVNTLDGDFEVTRRTVTVQGTDAIYLAGRTDVTIPSLSNSDNSFILTRIGVDPGDPVFNTLSLETFPKSFSVSHGQTFTFSASGGVDYYLSPSANFESPDGTGISDIQSLGGISGYKGPHSLVGLFLNDNNPANSSPPTTLNFFPDFSTLAPNLGQVFLIGDGVTSRGLTQQFITPTGATRLFLGIADYDAGNAPGNYEDNDGSFTVQIDSTDDSLKKNYDLSTDFGVTGTKNDEISLAIEFDADETAEMLYLQYVFGSEEFLESALASGSNDSFSMELNGFNMAVLSDGAEVGINTLAPAHPDFIYNPVGTGPASNLTKLDGYTKPLTSSGFLETGTRNRLEIKIKDVNNGDRDSAVFLKGGTFGTVNSSSNGGGGNGGGNGGGGGGTSVSVPEPSSGWGILAFGAMTVIYFWKKHRTKGN